MSQLAPRWEDTVPRRRVVVTAVVAAVIALALAAIIAGVLLERRSDQADSRLDAACQDNRARAHGAAQLANNRKLTEAVAVDAARTYIKEVRTTPTCFDREVEEDADAVERAIRGGGRPSPQYPIGVE